MSVIGALKAYSRLTKEQKQLLRAKRLEADYTPEQWLELLEGLAHYDAEGDRLRKFSGIGFFVLLIPAIIGLIGFPPILILVLPLMALAGIVWLLTRRADLSNHLRLFVVPLITLLGDDVKPGRTMHLKLDLRGGLAKDKRGEQKEPYKKGVYYKIIETWYTDPWLSADMLLSDGCQLTMDLTDAIRELKKTKRNPRGKIKTKKKYKVKGLMDVHLKLPAQRYRIGDAEAVERMAPRIQIREGEKWLGLRGRGVAVRAGTELEAPQVRPLLDLVTQLYRLTELKPQEGAANV